MVSRRRRARIQHADISVPADKKKKEEENQNFKKCLPE